MQGGRAKKEAGAEVVDCDRVIMQYHNHSGHIGFQASSDTRTSMYSGLNKVHYKIPVPSIKPFWSNCNYSLVSF